MGHQSRLVLLLFLSVGGLHVVRSSTPQPPSFKIVHDAVDDNKSDSAEVPISSNPTTNTIKNSTPKLKDTAVHEKPTSVTKRTPKASTTPIVSDEVLNDLLEASKHSVALAEDPRFNKMLPDRLKAQNTSSNSNKSDENYDEYENYDYDEDYNYDNYDTTSTVKPKPEATTSKIEKNKFEMKLVKGFGKTKPVSETNDQQQTNNIDGNDDYGDDYNGNDSDDNNNNGPEDDIADEEEIIFSENVPCPRYCVCARNINSYLVATCSRLDPGTQKFGSDITDIVVTDVGPKYPILLGPKFFQQLGLKHVASIKIANCTIEFMHPEAFYGLDELYAVNLTNVGLAIINPDTFSQNKKLRMLTISGNDLSVMSSVHYLLKSSTIEELDLSRNNLMELNANAFSQLSNIVYINLSQNNLQKIPEKVFDFVETIEELDLSYNALKELPAAIFNRTALAILHLKYNSFTDLNFATSDLQQCDLSFNAISHIHHGMFDKMVGLTNLNLKGNGITKIQPDSFLTLKSLRHIDLSMNELDQISSMIFYKNSELDVIRLNDNPRLSQLPTDGFLSYNGVFTVYLLDISNCAIGALGHKTFSTMPHLATLKLAWNNINNLERDTFAILTKLNDLDLSNNLIAKVDELLFMNNNELTKLNLAGNPIRKLSVRLFLPMNKLRDLDVSDCELNSLLVDNQYGVGRKYRFYETLRSFNVSANHIKKISVNDIRNFKNLRTLDIMHNPLKCNDDFQNFISYATLNTHMVPKRIPSLANMEDVESYTEIQSQASWEQLAREVCKHHESLKSDSNVEKRISDADKELDEDAKDLMNIIDNSKLSKMQKILKDSKKTEIVNDDLGGNFDEEELNNGGETKDDDDEENASDYDDGDDDDNEDDDADIKNNNIDDDYDSFDKQLTKSQKVNTPKLKDHGVKIEEVELTKETRDKFLLHKFGFEDDDISNNSDEDEEIIIERGRIYYTGNKFLIPIVVIVTSIIILLLIIAKVVTIVMRKRGERYRMALLASTNNSIVYQKLSEEIVKPIKVKEVKHPKVHRYAPIDQV